ncbi:hypothetical protein WJX73_007034 [Symbiochloris irregularis]|uniref:Uncharacterized protein n=1 Tax=Symbiochloris irregularis TaxID=706552 RepID=A0AAW1PVJ7_9CHLO
MADQNQGQGTVDAFRDTAQQYSRKLDQQLSNAATAVKSGSAQATQAYGAVQSRTETFLDTGIAHFKATEQQVFDKLKEVVEHGMNNPALSYSVIGGTALLLLPGLRGVLFRQTFGRLRSEEGILRKAEKRAQDVRERVSYATSEGGKLDSRLAHAMEQWQTGLGKTKSAAKQLQGLASTVEGIEKSANKAVVELRYVSKKDAILLRTEIASQLALAKAQRRAIEKTLWGLTKKGL